MLTFGDAALCYPLITAAHVLEEWHRFPAWAQRFASPRYSRREYERTHVATLVVATSGALLVRIIPGSWSTLVFFGLLFGPAVACNALFHIGASVVTRTFCPGVVTSAVLYVPATVVLIAAVLRDALLGPVALGATLAVAAVLHVLEVGHNVFKRW